MQYAVITIELPLDNGELADAKALADHIARRTLTTNLHDLNRDVSKVYGSVTSVKLVQKEN
jgi:hypothetical protein